MNEPADDDSAGNERKIAMIVTTGKSIKIDVGCFGLRVERSCETPGAVTVTCGSDGRLTLPGNPEDAERFIAAYRRALAEDIPYRESRVESAKP